MLHRLRRLPGQLVGRSPLAGTLPVRRLPFWPTARVTARHFRTPLRILDFVYASDDPSHDTAYIDVPGFPPIVFLRDPEMIREITIQTAAAKDAEFDRDQLPTQGIARVVGSDNLLYAQGDEWRAQKRAVARPLGPGAVQTPEVFSDLERQIKAAVEPQLVDLAGRVESSGQTWHRMRLEPEVKAVMLHLLVNVMFGVKTDYNLLRNRYLPAIERVIDYIMLDTVANPCAVPTFKIPTISRRHARLKEDRAACEELVERVIAGRDERLGFWPLLTATGPEETVRSNVRVFLAGALEATTSLFCWTLAELARHPQAQQRAFEEAQALTQLTPQVRKQSTYLNHVLNEALRLHNALYFLPRVVLKDTTLTTSRGTLTMPARTHLVLATYHANRCETYWGEQATGYPATAFEPDRWDERNLAAHGRRAQENLHFGFGHGPRICVGKNFSEVEAFVCLVLFLRRFEIRADTPMPEAESGVSTHCADALELELRPRFLGKSDDLGTPPAAGPASSVENVE